MSNDILNKAMDLLARREHSRYELFSKLEIRGFEKDAINTVLNQLEAKNLLSDFRFAESYSRAKTNRGFGPIRIRQELHDRGIDSETISKILSLLQDNFFSAAKNTRIKKFGTNIPESFEDKAKQMRFLQYRGFNSDQIKAAFEE